MGASAVRLALATLLGALLASAGLDGQAVTIDATDLSQRDRLRFLVFGDAGTGEAGQFRVGQAMASVCRMRGCDFALMLGDNIYENGIEVRHRDDADLSLAEILDQFDRKFEQPYAPFGDFPGFRFWAALGNHDYRRNAVGAMITYSEFSDLWRLPALHYDIPQLPSWIQIQAVHTDTDVRRDLNGLQIEAIRRRLCASEPANRWRLLFGHQPVYNSGHHRRDGNERRARALLLDLLIRECGVHVYFSGHAHHQEHLTVDGFEQVIQGAAARTKGSNRPSDDTVLRQRFFSRTFGFARVEVDADLLRLEFYDVRHTEERERTPRPLADDDIVMTYSWCGTRADIGQPSREASPCPPSDAAPR